MPLAFRRAAGNVAADMTVHRINWRLVAITAAATWAISVALDAVAGDKLRNAIRKVIP